VAHQYNVSGVSPRLWVAIGAVTGTLVAWAHVSMGQPTKAPKLQTSLVSTEVISFFPSAQESVPTLPGGEALAKTPERERISSEVHPASDRHECGESMQLVEGGYCTAVEHACLKPLKDGSLRCKRFAPRSHCYPPVIKMRFCMDRFEYPNRAGEKPTVMVNYREAKAACEMQHKRLCTAREWTLACEGPDLLPYPNGYARDSRKCNIDRPYRVPDIEALMNTTTRDVELARLDQRNPSGSMPNCVSAFGVYDLIGNVDEWVTPDGPEEPAGLNNEAALKGGYFGPVRTRCRPSTTAHGATFKFYQVGFRCCSAADSDDR